MAMMRYVNSLLLVLLVGCAGHSRQATPIAIWRSANSTPEQRVEAVASLVPVGTTRTEVQRVLGQNGRWTHWHGPSATLSIENGVATAHSIVNHDEWTLEYPVSGGAVALFFQSSETGRHDDFKFVRVAFRKSLQTHPSTAGNSVR